MIFTSHKQIEGAKAKLAEFKLQEQASSKFGRKVMATEDEI
jgi:hypothetical protein